MAIKIPFIAEVRQFIAGTTDVVRELGKVSDSLDDITIAGDSTSRQVSDDLDRIGDSADDSADRMSRSFRTAFDTLERQGRTASRKTVRDVDDVGKRGSASMREFGQEARQNVAETLSSFNGSASSAVDAVQGTFGGLVSALGPAGLLGAAAAAAGVGLARGLFEKSKAAAQEVAEAVADITGQLIELGSLDLGTEQVNEKLKEFATTAEDGKNVLVDLSTQAKAAGIDSVNFLRGMAGDSEALKTAYDELRARTLELDQSEQDLMHTHGATQEQIDGLIAKNLEAREAVDKATKAVLEQDSTLDMAGEAYRTYEDATRGSTTALEKQSGATQDAIEKAKGLDEALGNIPATKGTTVTVDVDMAGVDATIRNFFAGRSYPFNVYARPGKPVAG